MWKENGLGKNRGKHLEILEIEGESIEKKYVLTHKGFVNNNHWGSTKGIPEAKKVCLHSYSSPFIIL